MSSIETQEQNKSTPLTKEDYNNIPVYYCKDCGSLAVMTVAGFPDDYCDKCGSTNIGKASIEAWQELQRTVYNPIREEEKRRHRINIFR
jgi:hypothetical protein